MTGFDDGITIHIPEGVLIYLVVGVGIFLGLRWLADEESTSAIALTVAWPILLPFLVLVSPFLLAGTGRRWIVERLADRRRDRLRAESERVFARFDEGKLRFKVVHDIAEQRYASGELSLDERFAFEERLRGRAKAWWQENPDETALPVGFEADLVAEYAPSTDVLEKRRREQQSEAEIDRQVGGWLSAHPEARGEVPQDVFEELTRDLDD